MRGTRTGTEGAAAGTCPRDAEPGSGRSVPRLSPPRRGILPKASLWVRGGDSRRPAWVG